MQDASYDRIFQPSVAQVIIAQLIQAVAYLHSHGIVHSGLKMFSLQSHVFTYIFLDLHKGNILLRLPKSINDLTPNQLYQQYSQPVCVPVKTLDGEKPAGDSIPTHAVVPVWLGKESENITLPEAHIYLIDFGESFMPSLTNRDYSSTPIIL